MNRSQSGSAIIYILIAIALLAALAFTIMNTSRSGGESLTALQTRVIADEVIQYGETVANAVQKLKLRGCTDNEISFETDATGATYENGSAPTNESCHVFSLSGGAIQWQEGRPDIEDPSSYAKYSYKDIAIPGMGTSAADLVLMLEPDDSPAVKFDQVCLRINKNLKLQDESDSSLLTDEAAGAWSAFTGTYDDANLLWGNSAELVGQPAYCVYENDNILGAFFLQTLIAR